MAVDYDQKKTQCEDFLGDYYEKSKSEARFDIEEYLFFLDIFNTV